MSDYTSRTRASQPPVSGTLAGNGIAPRQKALRARRDWRLSPLCMAVAQVFTTATCISMVGTTYAAPQGGKVVAGQAQINTGTLQTTVVQSTNRAVIDWTSFNLAPYESVRFVQPSSTAATLNRVRSSSGTEIAGRITANGQVYLVNPNGILFTRDASVNVSSLVASTADIANDAFMNERADSLNFNIPGAAGARVVNRGTINVAERGMAALLGAQVSNEGFITAKLGRIALAAGDGFTLSLSGNQLFNLILTEGQLQRVTDASGTPLAARVDAGGTINAQGGRVELTADTVAKLLDSAINITGDVRATTFQSEGGVIRLQGGRRTDLSVTGTVQAGGTATGAGLSAAGMRDVTLASSTIDLSQGGAVDFNAQRHINVTASLNGRSSTGAQGSTLNLSAQGDITLGSDVEVATMNAALTLSAGQHLASSAGSKVSSGTAATVLEGGSNVALNGAVVSTGAVIVRSANGGVTAATALAGTAAQAQGSVTAVTPSSISVNAAMAVTLAGVTAGTIDITGASVTSSRDLVANTTVGTTTSQLGVSGNSIKVTGAAGVNLSVVQSTGAVELRSSQGGVIVSSAVAGSAGELNSITTLAAASLKVEAAGDVALNGAKLGTGGLNVGQEAVVGNLTLGAASIISAGAINASARGNITINPLVSSAGNTAFTSTAGNITVGGVGQTTTLAASQGGSLTLTASNGTITAQAGSTLSSGAAATTLSGALAVTVDGNIVSTGGVTVESSRGSLTLSTTIAGVSGNNNGPAHVTLRANGANQDVTLAGVKAGSITVEAGRDVLGLSNLATDPATLLSQSGAITLTAGRRIGAEAASAPVNQGLAVSAQTDVTASGAQGVRLQSVQATGDVRLNSAAGGVQLAGAVSGVSSTTPAPSLEAAPAARSLTILAAGEVGLNGAKLGSGGLMVGVGNGAAAPVGSLSLGTASVLSTGAVDVRASG
jgi:filamentous hemagglutinin family protein